MDLGKIKSYLHWLTETYICRYARFADGRFAISCDGAAWRVIDVGFPLERSIQTVYLDTKEDIEA